MKLHSEVLTTYLSQASYVMGSNKLKHNLCNITLLFHEYATLKNLQRENKT